MTEEKVITIQGQILWDKIEAFRKTHSDEETLQEVEINAINYIEVGKNLILNQD